MTKKRKRRKPEQIVKLLQEGDAMLAAGKSLAEVYQNARDYRVYVAAMEEAVWRHEVG